MVKKGELFNAYSSYFNILENIGQYSSQNTAKLILLSFIEQMKADGFYSTLLEADRKVIDAIVECIKKKLCILLYTSACMKKKAEKVYIGEYEDCIFYNKTVPEYEDMNPSWELLTVTCQINPATGYNTGRKISTYQNVNPLFKGPQIYTEEVIDSSSCPYNAPNWVEESRSCEQSEGINTGYQLVVYRDNNTNSATYGQTRTERNFNTEACPIESTDPIWVEISRACNTVSYEHSSDSSALHTTGYATVTVRDENPASSSYGQETTNPHVSDTNCPLENIGYLTFSNGQKTKMVSSNSGAYSTTIPLNYYINDVLQNPWNSNVIPHEGDLNITTHDGDCTVTISAPKNTTGQTRTFIETIGANYFDDVITFTLTQAADAVFKWSDNTLAKNDTAVAAGVTRNYTVISTAGGEFKNYSISSATSGISASISSNTITVTVAQNPNTSARTLVLKLKQQGSNNEITLTVQQEAAAQPQPVAVFSVSPVSLSFNDVNQTRTLTVTSTIDNVSTGFTVTKDAALTNYTVTQNGNTVTVTSPSQVSALTGSLLFTQNTSGNTATVPVTQTAPAYVFTWGDDTTAPKVLAADPDGDEVQYVVKSRKNGTIYYTWDVEGNIPDWLHTDKVVPASGEPSINLTIDKNNGYRQRPTEGTQTITLYQKEGSVVKNTLAVQVSQAGSTAESFDLSIQAGPRTVMFPMMAVTTFISGEIQVFDTDNFEGYESGVVRMPEDGEIEFSVTVQEVGGGQTLSLIHI